MMHYVEDMLRKLRLCVCVALTGMSTTAAPISTLLTGSQESPLHQPSYNVGSTRGNGEMVQMLSMLNIKGGFHHRTYYIISCKILSKLLHDLAVDLLKRSHAFVHEMYDDMYRHHDGPHDITVSYDGTSKDIYRVFCF